MTGLPSAVVRAPDCGACGAETTSEDDYLVCYDCQLVFAGDDLTASFLDSGSEACGAPCDNYWHKPGVIKPGFGFVCHPCQLPQGHGDPRSHWTGCESVALTPDIMPLERGEVPT